GLDLLEAVAVRERIELREEPVEQVAGGAWLELGRAPGETDEVGGEERRRVEPVRDRRLARGQAFGDPGRQDVEQQSLRGRLGLGQGSRLSLDDPALGEDVTRAALELIGRAKPDRDGGRDEERL